MQEKKDPFWAEEHFRCLLLVSFGADKGARMRLPDARVQPLSAAGASPRVGSGAGLWGMWD